MKTKSAVLLAATFLAATGATHANTVDWTIDAIDTTALSGNPDSETWQYVFLTDPTETYTTSSIRSLQVNSGSNAGVECDDGSFIGTWTDSLNDGNTQYVVALWDGDSGEYNFFADSSGNLFTAFASDLMETSEPTSGSHGGNTQGSAVLAILSEGPDETGALGNSGYSTANVTTGTQPLEQRPTISAFAVSGNTATLTVANAVSGAWYAVFSSTTPDASATKTLLGEAQQASGETVPFSNLDATGDAKFYFVAGAATKDGAETWE